MSFTELVRSPTSHSFDQVLVGNWGIQTLQSVLSPTPASPLELEPTFSPAKPSVTILPYERIMANAVMYSGPLTKAQHEAKQNEVRRAHYTAKAYPPARPLTRLQHQLHQALAVEAERRGFSHDSILLCPHVEEADVLEKL